MSIHQLMDYFNFDESDLQANRKGQITDLQLAELRADDKSTNHFAMTVGVALISGALVFIYLFYQWDSLNLFGMAGCLAPILIGVFAIRLGLKKTNFTLAKTRDRVNIVIEENYSPTLRRRVSKYVMHIGEAAFEVESEAAGFIMQGDRYAVYYIEETDRIMSLEKIS